MKKIIYINTLGNNDSSSTNYVNDLFLYSFFILMKYLIKINLMRYLLVKKEQEQ